jgi:hypothetical protein
VDPRGLTFKLYGHKFSTFNECKDLKSMQNNIQEIKQFVAPNTAGLSYIDIPLNESEFRSLKPYKGLAFSIVDEGKLTVHDIKCSILYNIQENVQEDPNRIVLYDHGYENKNTEFDNLYIDNTYKQNDRLGTVSLSLNENYYYWFSYDGFINIDDYESFEITLYTEYANDTPYIELRLFEKSRMGYGKQPPAYDYFTAKTQKLITPNTKETTYTFSRSAILSLIESAGYSKGFLEFLIFECRQETKNARVYITKIVANKKSSNEPSTPTPPTPPTTEEIVLYNNGIKNHTTEFSYLTIDRPYSHSDKIGYNGGINISSGGLYFWFGYSGLIDLNNYDNFKVTFNTDYDASFTYIHLRIVTSTRFGYGDSQPTYTYNINNNLPVEVTHNSGNITYTFTKDYLRQLIQAAGSSLGYIEFLVNDRHQNQLVFITKITATKL